ncbi:hypothetical protein A3849_08555 [Paenibacillus sp. P46E]|nr:hypothetical protein A3849_08555 [Paenibacillus sp. P46E]
MGLSHKWIFYEQRQTSPFFKNLKSQQSSDPPLLEDRCSAFLVIGYGGVNDTNEVVFGNTLLMKWLCGNSILPKNGFFAFF